MEPFVITNPEGKVIARLEGSVLLDPMGKVVARLENNVAILDPMGAVIGRVGENHEVTDPLGKVLGWMFPDQMLIVNQLGQVRARYYGGRQVMPKFSNAQTVWDNATPEQRAVYLDKIKAPSKPYAPAYINEPWDKLPTDVKQYLMESGQFAAKFGSSLQFEDRDIYSLFRQALAQGLNTDEAVARVIRHKNLGQDQVLAALKRAEDAGLPFPAGQGFAAKFDSANPQDWWDSMSPTQRAEALRSGGVRMTPRTIEAMWFELPASEQQAISKLFEGALVPQYAARWNASSLIQRKALLAACKFTQHADLLGKWETLPLTAQRTLAAKFAANPWDELDPSQRYAVLYNLGYADHTETDEWADTASFNQLPAELQKEISAYFASGEAKRDLGYQAMPEPDRVKKLTGAGYPKSMARKFASREWKDLSSEIKKVFGSDEENLAAESWARLPKDKAKQLLLTNNYSEQEAASYSQTAWWSLPEEVRRDLMQDWWTDRFAAKFDAQQDIESAGYITGTTATTVWARKKTAPMQGTGEVQHAATWDELKVKLNLRAANVKFDAASHWNEMSVDQKQSDATALGWDSSAAQLPWNKLTPEQQKVYTQHYSKENMSAKFAMSEDEIGRSWDNKVQSGLGTVLLTDAGISGDEAEAPDGSWKKWKDLSESTRAKLRRVLTPAFAAKFDQVPAPQYQVGQKVQYFDDASDSWNLAKVLETPQGGGLVIECDGERKELPAEVVANVIKPVETPMEAKLGAKFDAATDWDALSTRQRGDFLIKQLGVNPSSARSLAQYRWVALPQDAKNAILDNPPNQKMGAGAKFATPSKRDSIRDVIADTVDPDRVPDATGAKRILQRLGEMYPGVQATSEEVINIWNQMNQEQGYPTSFAASSLRGRGNNAGAKFAVLGPAKLAELWDGLDQEQRNEVLRVMPTRVQSITPVSSWKDVARAVDGATLPVVIDALKRAAGIEMAFGAKFVGLRIDSGEWMTMSVSARRAALEAVNAELSLATASWRDIPSDIQERLRKESLMTGPGFAAKFSIEGETWELLSRGDQRALLEKSGLQGEVSNYVGEAWASIPAYHQQYLRRALRDMAREGFAAKFNAQSWNDIADDSRLDLLKQCGCDETLVNTPWEEMPEEVKEKITAQMAHVHMNVSAGLATARGLKAAAIQVGDIVEDDWERHGKVVEGPRTNAKGKLEVGIKWDHVPGVHWEEVDLLFKMKARGLKAAAGTIKQEDGEWYFFPDDKYLPREGPWASEEEAKKAMRMSAKFAAIDSYQAPEGFVVKVKDFANDGEVIEAERVMGVTAAKHPTGKVVSQTYKTREEGQAMIDRLKTAGFSAKFGTVENAQGFWDDPDPTGNLRADKEEAARALGLSPAIASKKWAQLDAGTQQKLVQYLIERGLSEENFSAKFASDADTVAQIQQKAKAGEAPVDIIRWLVSSSGLNLDADRAAALVTQSGILQQQMGAKFTTPVPVPVEVISWYRNLPEDQKQKLFGFKHGWGELFESQKQIVLREAQEQGIKFDAGDVAFDKAKAEGKSSEEAQIAAIAATQDEAAKNPERYSEKMRADAAAYWQTLDPQYRVGLIEMFGDLYRQPVPEKERIGYALGTFEMLPPAIKNALIRADNYKALAPTPHSAKYQSKLSKEQVAQKFGGGFPQTGDPERDWNRMSRDQHWQVIEATFSSPNQADANKSWAQLPDNVRDGLLEEYQNYGSFWTPSVAGEYAATVPTETGTETRKFRSAQEAADFLAKHGFTRHPDRVVNRVMQTGKWGALSGARIERITQA